MVSQLAVSRLQLALPAANPVNGQLPMTRRNGSSAR